MRALAALCLLLFCAGCRRAEQPATQRDQAAAAQSTSDVPPRGIEPPSPTGAPAPPHAGANRALPADAGAPAETDADDETGPCAADTDCRMTRMGRSTCCETL